MANDLIYFAGGTAASRYACTYLTELGLPIVQQPGAEVGHLILDVPSFGPEGQLRMGGDVDNILKILPADAIVYGGNLKHPALQDHRTVDFLQDADYLAQNAYITAECALDVALPYLHITLRDCPTLILGWGRIGKCLGQLLKVIDADVTIAARKEADRSILHALGYNTIHPSLLNEQLGKYRLIFNTVPELILKRSQMAHCRADCVIIELASKNGMEHEDVIIARGLPGIHMPESSGILIAETFLRHYKEESL